MWQRRALFRILTGRVCKRQRSVMEYLFYTDDTRAEYSKNLLKYLSEELSGELSWSHDRLLMRIDNEERRNFYQEECVKSKWSVRQLEQQINTFYYDRILASRDKESVAEILARIRTWFLLI